MSSAVKAESLNYFRQHAPYRLQFFPESMVDALNKPMAARSLHESQLHEGDLWSHHDLAAIEEGIAQVVINMVESQVNPQVITNEILMTLGPLAEMVAVMKAGMAEGPDEDLAESVDIALDSLIAL